MNELPLQWQRDHPHFTYVPVISDALPEDAWTGRTGLVHQAVLADFPDLSYHQAYVCGAPAMVEAAKRDFVALCGLPHDEFFADSFTFAADKVAAPDRRRRATRRSRCGRFSRRVRRPPATLCRISPASTGRYDPPTIQVKRPPRGGQGHEHTEEDPAKRSRSAAFAAPEHGTGDGLSDFASAIAQRIGLGSSLTIALRGVLMRARTGPDLARREAGRSAHRPQG